MSRKNCLRKGARKADWKNASAAAIFLFSFMFAPSVLAEPGRSKGDGETLTEQQIKALIDQISSCWQMPPNVSELKGMTVKIMLEMQPDRTVGAIRIAEDQPRITPEWWAMAESARRAVLKCSPLHLPEEKYEAWKKITIIFNPDLVS